MYSDQDEAKSKLPAFICKLDAAKHTEANIGLYTDSQIAAAYSIAALADGAYFCKGIHVNFRKNRAVIKLDRVQDPVTVELALSLKEYAETNGFEKEYIARSHSIKFVSARVEKS